MTYKTLEDLDLADKRALIRVDINVPLEDGRVTDDTRIRRIVPTVKAVLEAGGRPVLLAHFGRPKGKVVPEMSLGVLRQPLEDAIGAPVVFGAQEAQSGQVLLLENVRFNPGEEKNDPGFAQELAALGDIYINDAFSVSHRAHASTEAIARLLPSAAGLNMGAELSALEKALSSPERPVVAVVGGAKVSTKLELIGNLLEKVDAVVIGGGMANTFLAAQGHSVGKSLCEHDMLDTARDIMKKAEASGCDLILPKDVVVAEAFEANSPHRTVPADQCPDDMMILDAGAESVAEVVARFGVAKTIVWNGPLGAFELEPFDAATNAAAEAAARLTKEGKVLSVAGGGDTVAALNASGAADHFTYVSTAGGAFLEWLEGKTLPGVAALEA